MKLNIVFNCTLAVLRFSLEIFYQIHCNYNVLSMYISESETECTENRDFSDLREGDQVRLDCSVKYYGFYGPTMIFKDSRGTTLQPVEINEPDTIRFYYQVLFL